MERRGCPRNVVILTQPLGFVKQPNKMVPLMKVVLRHYPACVKAMEIRHLRYNRQAEYVREQEIAGNAFVIRPPQPLNIGHTSDDPDELRRVYQIGRDVMTSRLDELKAFLS